MCLVWFAGSSYLPAETSVAVIGYKISNSAELQNNSQSVDESSQLSFCCKLFEKNKYIFVT